MGQKIEGSFAFELATNAQGEKIVRVAVVDAGMSFGGAVEIFNGEGSLIITGAGIAGKLSVDIRIDVKDAAFSGSFELAINTIKSAVSESIPVGGKVINLELPQGPYVRIAGTDIRLTIFGQTLKGDFAFEHVAGETILLAANVSLSLGNGTTSFVTVSSGQGILLITQDGLSGSLSASVSINVPGVDLSGSFAILINNSRTQINREFTIKEDPINGDEKIQLNLVAGPYLRVDIKNAELNILGQTFGGSFFFEQAMTSDNQRVVSLGANGVFLNLSDGTTNFVEVSDGTAKFMITDKGLAGELSAKVKITIPDPIDPSGFSTSTVDSIKVVVNTTQQAVDTQMNIGDVTEILRLDAGPYVQVNVDGLDLNLLGQSFRGNFVFEMKTSTSGGKMVKLGASEVELDFGDGNKDYVVVTKGTGLLIITDKGIAGSLSARVEIQNIENVSFEGIFGIAVNTMDQEVHEAFTLGQTLVSLDLPKGPYVKVEGSDIALTVAGQTLKGNFAFEQKTEENGSKTITVTASDISLRFGDGKTDFVVVSNGYGTIVIDENGFAGAIGATVALNVPGVNFSGTFHLLVIEAVNDISRTVEVDGEAVVINKAAGTSIVRVEGNDIFMDVLGQQLSGSFSFEKVTSTVQGGEPRTVVRIAVSDLRLGLGDGSRDYVVVENGEGSLLIYNKGIAGSISADIRIQNISGVSFTGNFGLDINTIDEEINETFIVNGIARPLHLSKGPYLKVAGNDIDLEILGQTLQGNFQFEHYTNADGVKVVRIAAEGVKLSIRNGDTEIISLEQDDDDIGYLMILPQGVVGQLSASLSLGDQISQFLSISSEVELKFNTLPIAFSDTFTINGVERSINVRAGPYVEISAVNTQIGIKGHTFSGDFYFSQAKDANNNNITILAVSNIDITINGEGIKNGTGVLIIKQSGIAGLVLGDASIKTPGSGFEVGASVGLSINTTGELINEEIVVNGRTIKVSAEADEEFAFLIQDLEFNFGGILEIRGDFKITNNAFSGTNLEIFIGMGPWIDENGSENPDAIGILLTEASILFKSTGENGKYAIYASGKLALVGLDGLVVEGTASFSVNTSTPADKCHINVPFGIHRFS